MCFVWWRHGAGDVKRQTLNHPIDHADDLSAHANTSLHYCLDDRVVKAHVSRAGGRGLNRAEAMV